MVGRICDKYVLPNLTDITAKFEVINHATKNNDRLDRDIFRRNHSRAKAGIFGFLRSKSESVNDDMALPEIGGLAAWKGVAGRAEPAQRDYLLALITIVGALLAGMADLWLIVILFLDLCLRIVMNNFGSREIGRMIRPMFNDAVAQEGYRSTSPIASDRDEHKRGIRLWKKHNSTATRRLAQKMNVKWEDFALISPDYWRKYLLDYESMGRQICRDDDWA